MKGIRERRRMITNLTKSKSLPKRVRVVWSKYIGDCMLVTDWEDDERVRDGDVVGTYELVEAKQVRVTTSIEMERLPIGKQRSKP